MSNEPTLKELNETVASDYLNEKASIARIALGIESGQVAEDPSFIAYMALASFGPKNDYTGERSAAQRVKQEWGMRILAPAQKIAGRRLMKPAIPSLKFTESDDAIIANHDAKVKARARVEVAICRRLLHDLNAAGYFMKIDDGGDEEIPVHDFDKVMRDLFAVDEATVLARKSGETSYKWVKLVFGNDGFDLISDYAVSIDPIIEPIQDWAEAAHDAGCCPVFDAALAQPAPLLRPEGAINRKALDLLHIYTAHTFDFDRLCGDGMKEQRRQIMSALCGRKMPGSKSGINTIQAHFYAMAGGTLDGYTCERDRELKFAAWAKSKMPVAA